MPLFFYEEHILQICEAFAGLPPGRADVLRRALNKQNRVVRFRSERASAGIICRHCGGHVLPGHVNRLGEFVRQTVRVCGLVVEQRVHHQITGEPMKFLSLADWTGIIETELFAKTYKSYGLATVHYPVLEIEARVEPFENGRRFILRALAARRHRSI